MRKNELEITLKKLAGIFNLEKYAKEMPAKGNVLEMGSKISIWDALDIACEKEADYICIGNGKHVECASIFRKVRIPFFLLLAEFESRLFRIHEWSGKDIAILNEKYINELIKELLDSDLINLQKTYNNRKEFREDMKAISSFRNVIMHVNKKLEKDLKANIILKRKKQVFRMLEAFQEILDGIRK